MINSLTVVGNVTRLSLSSATAIELTPPIVRRFSRAQENLRTANVRAETFTELQVMYAADFHALAEVFPEFKV